MNVWLVRRCQGLWVWWRDRCEEWVPKEWREERKTHLAGEGNEMVFAKAVDGDFPDQDHLVMIFGEDGIVDNV